MLKHARLASASVGVVGGGGRGRHLRQLSQAVQRVDVRRLEVGKAGEGLVVQLDALDGRQCGAFAVGDVRVERDGMPDELDGRLCKAKLCVQRVHRHHQQVAVLVRAGLSLIILLHISAGNRGRQFSLTELPRAGAKAWSMFAVVS